MQGMSLANTLYPLLAGGQQPSSSGGSSAISGTQLQGSSLPTAPTPGSAIGGSGAAMLGIAPTLLTTKENGQGGSTLLGG
jgi:hypothetical protein